MAPHDGSVPTTFERSAAVLVAVIALVIVFSWVLLLLFALGRIGSAIGLDAERALFFAVLVSLAAAAIPTFWTYGITLKRLTGRRRAARASFVGAAVLIVAAVAT